MSEFGDDRIRFYLENKDLIDTWAALAAETRSTFSQWLLDLETDVAELAAEIGAASHLRDPDRWKIHMLANQGWNEKLDDDSTVVIAIEWNSSDVGVPAKLPYVGLRIAGGDDAAKARRQSFLDLCGDRLRNLDEYTVEQPRRWWSAWRYVAPADDRWWEHADDYRQLLLLSLEAAWQDLSPLVDEWIEAPSGRF